MAEEWDNTGLQVGNLSREIHTIFVALDPTFYSVQEASRHGAQLLLTHHPLIFKPLSQIERNHYPDNAIFEAVKRDISIVSAHTNLDVARGGINDMLAKKFNLKKVETLQKRNNVGINQGFGLGRIGDLPSSVSLSKMILKVKDILSADYLRIVGREDMEIKRIAIVGGAGGNLVPLAFSSGADLLVTGEVVERDRRRRRASGNDRIGEYTKTPRKRCPRHAAFVGVHVFQFLLVVAGHGHRSVFVTFTATGIAQHVRLTVVE